MRPVMEPLSREFIDSCRREEGRIIRGDNMTRIETFVDAAFAFAFTMLVISIDEIPKSPPERYELSRAIRAFVFSALIIGAVWLAHAESSCTIGLQDSITMFLSLALVNLMLVYVYAIKLMMQATVLYILLKYGIGCLITDCLTISAGQMVRWQACLSMSLSGLFLWVRLLSPFIRIRSVTGRAAHHGMSVTPATKSRWLEPGECRCMLSLVVALVSDEVVVAGAG